MKERPILFSGEMVKAILKGCKSQTRRVVKGIALEWLWLDMFTPEYVALPGNYFSLYGYTGDRLWVKETWAAVWPDEDPVPLEQCNIEYKADTGDLYPGSWPAEEARGNPEAPKWRSSRFMPKWVARIWLEITSVRVERLQSITEDDTFAEGIVTGKPYTYGEGVECYRALWNKLNARRGYPWESNPWVWVIEFQRLKIKEVQDDP